MMEATMAIGHDAIEDGLEHVAAILDRLGDQLDTTKLQEQIAEAKAKVEALVSDCEWARKAEEDQKAMSAKQKADKAAKEKIAAEKAKDKASAKPADASAPASVPY